MVYLTSKRIGMKKYFFLVRSVRIDQKVEKISISLGIRKPTEQKLKILKRLLEPKFFLEEAKLRAKHSVKNYKSDYFDGDELMQIEILRHFYRIYLHKLNPSELEKYKENFLVRYVYNTTSIEGNTTTLPETALILVNKITPKGKKMREIYEIENYEKLIVYMNKYRGDINKKLILKIHQILLNNIDNDTAGKFRASKVYIPGSEMKPPDPLEVEPMMEDLIDYYYKNKNMCPLELSVIFHHKFESIHPFTDGNGRVGRELLNFILKKSGFPPLIIEVKKRQKYIKSLMKADDGHISSLMDFISETLIKQYQDLIKIDANKIDKKVEEILKQNKK